MENFKNKFTAEYLFLINQTESSIPRINQANISRRKELDMQWAALEKEANKLEEDIAAFNKKLWEEGIGAIYLK